MAQDQERASSKIAGAESDIENDLGKLRKPFEECSASEYRQGTLDVLPASPALSQDRAPSRKGLETPLL
jgi:hypothetical protein